tara:strand:- start:46364 stop:47413 length:1050 start_codon:yes stop_codon:yes gene_type:complete
MTTLPKNPVTDMMANDESAKKSEANNGMSDAEIMAKLGMTPDAEKKPKDSGKDSTITDGDEQIADDANSDDETDDSAQADDNSPASDELPADVKAAIKAIKRDGTPDHRIDDLEPDQILEWAEGIKKRQRDTAEAFKAKARLEELEAEDAQPKKGEDKDAAPAKSSTPAEVETAMEKFEALYGTEFSEPMKLIVNSMQNSANDRVASLEEQVQQMQKSRVESDVTSARHELDATYPDMDEDDFAKIEKRMGGLVSDETYRGPDAVPKLMRDAALLVLGPPAEKKNNATDKADRDTRRTRRKSSQPLVDAKTKSISALSRDDAEFRSFQLIREGKTEEARAMMQTWDSSH